MRGAEEAGEAGEAGGAEEAGKAGEAGGAEEAGENISLFFCILFSNVQFLRFN